MFRRILFISVCILLGLAACNTPQASPPRVPESQTLVTPGSSGTSSSETPETSQGANTPSPGATPESSKSTSTSSLVATTTPAPTVAPARIATSTAAAVTALTFSGTGKQATSTFEWDGPALFRFDLQKSKSIHSVILLDGSDGQMQTILFSGMGNTNASAVQGLKKGRYIVNISAPEESAWTLTIAKS